MTDSAYTDIRRSLWEGSFQAAVDYDRYVSEGNEKHRKRWLQMASSIPSLDPQAETRLTGYHRRLNVLLVSGIWCGDCVRQGPIIQQIAEACDEEIALRVIDRDQDPVLRDEVRILGALRVPVVIFLTEDFFEVGRFGDRTLSTYRAKAVNEAGASCPLPGANGDTDELKSMQNEWLDVFERMILMARLSPPLRERHGD